MTTPIDDAREQKRLQKKVYRRRYWESHKEQILDAQRAYRKTEHGQMMERAHEKRRRERMKSTEHGRQKILARYARRASQRRARAKPLDLLTAANSALNPRLPKHVRDDVIGSMMIDVFEGRLLVKDIAARSTEFVRRYNREHDGLKVLSLDAPVAGGDGSTTYVDLLPASTEDNPE